MNLLRTYSSIGRLPRKTVCLLVLCVGEADCIKQEKWGPSDVSKSDLSTQDMEAESLQSSEMTWKEKILQNYFDKECILTLDFACSQPWPSSDVLLNFANFTLSFDHSVQKISNITNQDSPSKEATASCTSLPGCLLAFSIRHVRKGRALCNKVRRMMDYYTHNLHLTFVAEYLGAYLSSAKAGKVLWWK